MSATAQQPVAKIGYFMDNAPQKHFLNPALTPIRGYFSYPVIGNFNVDVNSNLAVNNFMSFASMSEMTEAEFLSGFDNLNFINNNLRIGLLGAGLHFGPAFVSFDLGTRFTTEIKAPKDLFRFIKSGIDEDASSIDYDLSNLNLSTEVMGEAALGTSVEVIKGLRVGAKAKLLLGGAKISAGMEKLKLDINNDVVSIQSKGNLNMYAAALDFDYDNDTIVGFLLNENPAQIAGMGMAFDLGASYSVISSDLLTVNVSAGILDLGSMKWNKDHSSVAKAQSSFTMTREDFESMESLEEAEEAEANFQDQLMKMTKFVKQGGDNDIVERLTPTINAGVEVGTLKNKISLGLMYSQRFDPLIPTSEFTTMLNFNPISMLSVSASYALKKAEVPAIGVTQQLPTFGLGVGLNLLVANIFVACDYVPIDYVNAAANTHIQAGVSIALGKRKDKKN